MHTRQRRVKPDQGCRRLFVEMFRLIRLQIPLSAGFYYKGPVCYGIIIGDLVTLCIHHIHHDSVFNRLYEGKTTLWVLGVIFPGVLYPTVYLTIYTNLSKIPIS